MNRVNVFAGLVSLTMVAGCYSTLAYVPSPKAVERPLPNLELALSRYSEPKATKIDHGEGFTKATFAFDNVVRTRTIVYSEVASVKILEYLAAFQVVIYDAKGKELERFMANTLEDAQKLADALAAVAPALNQEPTVEQKK